ncbi:MAG TPA: DUF1599 domain-containing protein [Bacteroidales bacterium]|nr:DUF1599 domain-containing protein [Bacteroidales bacterium]
MSNTDKQYDQIKKICLDIFTVKLKDYGAAWRIMRPTALTDQLYIKAQRIRSLQNKGTQKILEGITPEFIGIVNYAIVGLIQLEMGVAAEPDISAGEAIERWNAYFEKARGLMHNKNHDYSEAWRSMRVSSLSDIILMKIMRVKQIEDNMGKTYVSEGVDANYYDIVNYSVFALIKLELEGANN